MKALMPFLIAVLLAKIFFTPLFAADGTDSSRITYGIWTNVQQNLHNADFKKILDCPSCSPGYRNGDGIGIGLGLVLDYPLSPNLMLSGKIFYNNIGAKLLRIESTKIIVVNVINDKIVFTSVDGAIEHSFDATIGVIGFEPSVKYNILGNIYLNFGLQTALLIRKDYAQVEKLIKPNIGTFILEDGTDTFSRERNKFSGTLESANSFYFAPSLSLSYKLPINSNKEWFLEPDLYYSLGISNIVSDILVKNWKTNSLGIGIALKYAPKKKELQKEEFKRIETIDTIRIIADNIDKDEFIYGATKSEIKVIEDYKVKSTIEIINRTDTIRIAKIVSIKKFETIAKIDTVTIITEGIDRDILLSGISKADTSVIISKNMILTRETITRTDTLKIVKIYKLDGYIAILGVDRQNVESNAPKFRVEEYTSNRLAPQLNYIFFDENSSELPARYVKIDAKETQKYNIKKLFTETNLGISYHLLNIVGKRMHDYPDANLQIVGCNSNIDNEKGNITLSQKRAETVSNYLNAVWGIDNQRLIISKRNLPEKYSKSEKEKMKREENQRVELYSDNHAILEPIFIEKIDRTADQPLIRFNPKLTAEAGIKNWKIKAYQLSDSVNVFVESGMGELPTSIDWDMEKSQKIIPKLPEPIICDLTVEDNKGNIKTISNKTEPVKVISLQQKRNNKQTNVEIEVFSLILFDFDKSKIEDKNKKIIELVRKRIKPESTIEIIGYSDITGTAKGNAILSVDRAKAVKKELGIPSASVIVGKELLFNNNLPEGRFYSRTVEIIVKTPTK